MVYTYKNSNLTQARLGCFSESFGLARRLFCQTARQIGHKTLELTALKKRDNLFTDGAYYPSRDKERLMVITSGLHGIEGYAGSALQQAFMHEALTDVISQGTSVLLVHALNPWGFKHDRRVDRENRDCNRIFPVGNEKDKENRIYAQMDRLLNPRSPYPGNKADALELFPSLLKYTIKYGAYEILNALTKGQNTNPAGLSFAGNGIPEEIKETMDYIQSIIDRYEKIIMVDLHSGYGSGLSVIVTEASTDRIKDMSKTFNVPLVSPSDISQHIVAGDMLSYYQRTYEAQKRFNSFALDFGLSQNEPLYLIKTLRLMRAENRIYHNGAINENDAKMVQQEMKELFYPSDQRLRLWLIAVGLKTIKDLHGGFAGLIR